MKRRFAVGILLLLLLTGCSGGQEPVEAQAVSLVLGSHAQFPQIAQSLYSERVYATVYSYGEISAVISDGQPGLAVHFRNQAPDKRIDDAKRRQLAQANTEAVLAQLAELRASEEEIDTLGAIHVAANTLQGSGLAQKTLVVIDSGLSTAGLMNFAASNLLDSDPAAVVEALEARRSLPDLTGIDVVVLGLGQTAGDQTPLDAESSGKLIDIWTAILQAAGPKSLYIDPTPLADLDPAADLPACSTVSVVKEQLKAEETETPVGPEPVRLSKVQFVSDQSEFLDRDEALMALEPVGQYLAENPSAAICLAGMTASTGGDGEELSLARAEACKALLLELGAADDQIQCLGLGRSENFLRVNDLDADGQLIEEEAQKNRAVFLFEQESETARRLGDQ